MNTSRILDFGGNVLAVSVSSSHLGSGSPSAASDAYHPKRAKHHSTDSKHEIAQLKTRLMQFITEILDEGKVVDLYALIYKDVEHLCVVKHSEQSLLAEFIFQEIDKTLDLKKLPQILKCLRNLTDTTVAKTAESLIDLCSAWDKTLLLLLQLFLYLDRSYLLHHPRHLCIREYGVKKFVGLLRGTNECDENPSESIYNLVSMLLAKMRRDRLSENWNDLSIKLVSKLTELDPEGMLLVNKSLDTMIINDYAKLLKIWLKNRTMYVPVLLKNMNEDSLMLIKASKPPSFVKCLNKKLQWQFLLSELSIHLESSLPTLTQPQNLHYLEAVKRICDTSMIDYSVDSTKILLLSWGKYAQKKARSILLDSNIILTVLELWNHLLFVCKNGFKSEAFDFEVRTALTKVMGQKDFASAIVFNLSRYCDIAMKQAGKSEDIFLELESNVLTIFKLLPDKLAFMSLYEKDFSRRILMAKYFSLPHEKRLSDAIVSVVGESDENFKLRAMLRDFSQSKSSFSSLTLPCAPELEFSALVLEKKVWPEIPGFSSEICLPDPLIQTLSQFENLYLSRDANHKKYDWKNYTLHQIALNTNFDLGSKELQVNLLQAIVLMLFQNSNSMSVSQILETTKMGDKLLRRVLSSLTTDKYPVLQVSGDVIEFNGNFSDKSKKIKLPMGKEKEIVTGEGVKKVIHQGRSSEARSALVRIMKTNKKMLYTDLLSKVLEDLTPRGVPEIQTIKAEVEYLILTDYIERDVSGKIVSYIP